MIKRTFTYGATEGYRTEDKLEITLKSSELTNTVT
jgi:hypothetical protein